MRVLIVFVVLLLLTALVIIIKKYKELKRELKEKTKKLDGLEISHLQASTELNVLQSQMNPHFLFNTLTAIYSLIRIRQDDARKLTLLLANYMRANVTSIARPLIKLSDELDVIEMYLSILKYRFSDQFQITIINMVEGGSNQIYIPPFTLQPLIENSIRHGLKKKSKEGLVTVKLQKRDNQICISVEDNGSGLPVEMRNRFGNERIQSDSGYGMSVYNINQRLILHVGEEAKLRTTDSEIGGLKVFFFLPEVKEG